MYYHAGSVSKIYKVPDRAAGTWREMPGAFLQYDLTQNTEGGGADTDSAADAADAADADADAAGSTGPGGPGAGVLFVLFKACAPSTDHRDGYSCAVEMLAELDAPGGGGGSGGGGRGSADAADAAAHQYERLRAPKPIEGVGGQVAMAVPEGTNLKTIGHPHPALCLGVTLVRGRVSRLGKGGMGGGGAARVVCRATVPPAAVRAALARPEALVPVEAVGTEDEGGAGGGGGGGLEYRSSLRLRYMPPIAGHFELRVVRVQGFRAEGARRVRVFATGVLPADKHRYKTAAAAAQPSASGTRMEAGWPAGGRPIRIRYANFKETSAPQTIVLAKVDYEDGRKDVLLGHCILPLMDVVLGRPAGESGGGGGGTGEGKEFPPIPLLSKGGGTNGELVLECR